MNTTSATRYPSHPKLALASALLKCDVRDWVTERRQEYGQSWERISQDLLRITKGQVSISREHLRRHFAEDEPAEVPTGT